MMIFGRKKEPIQHQAYQLVGEVHNRTTDMRGRYGIAKTHLQAALNDANGKIDLALKYIEGIYNVVGKVAALGADAASLTKQIQDEFDQPGGGGTDGT